MAMNTTVSHSYDDTFCVFDYITKDFIGEVALMSDGWAAYRSRGHSGLVVQRRVGTYASAQLAIEALAQKYAELKPKALKGAH